MEKLFAAINENINKISKALMAVAVVGSAAIGVVEGGFYLSIMLLAQCLFFSIAVAGGVYFVLWMQWKSPNHSIKVLNIFNLFFIAFFTLFAVIFTVMIFISDMELSQWFMYTISILFGILSLVGFRYKYIV